MAYPFRIKVRCVCVYVSVCVFVYLCVRACYTLIMLENQMSLFKSITILCDIFFYFLKQAQRGSGSHCILRLTTLYLYLWLKYHFTKETDLHVFDLELAEGSGVLVQVTKESIHILCCVIIIAYFWNKMSLTMWEQQSSFCVFSFEKQLIFN